MQDVRLILPQAAFRRAVAPVLVDPGRRVALGRVRWRSSSDGPELLVDDWEARSGLPTGDEFPPLHEYAVLVADPAGDLSVARLPEFVRPKRSHLVVGIILDPRDRSALPVSVWQHERFVPVSEVHLVGPGLVRLPDPTGPPADDLRSSRTRGALRALFDRIATLSVVVVGSGRGGSELARQLVAAGVRRLTLIDPDRIGPENLDAMPHATPRDVGRPKAVVLARRLRAGRPDDLTVSCLTTSVASPEGGRYLDGTRADTVFSFVDDEAARLAVAWKCRQGDLVHVDVGTLIRHDDQGRRSMRADVRLFEPGRGCVACVPPLDPVVLDDAVYALGAPPGALRRGRRVPWQRRRSGSLLHFNALASSLAVETWLSFVAGTLATSHWVRVLWPEGDVPRIESASVGPRPDCAFCRP